MGRMGNAMFQYVFCRAWAEQHGLTLQTDPWFGQHLFEINDPPIDRWITNHRDENSLKDDDKDFTYCSYSQQQKCMIYTRAQARKWFQIRRDVLEILKRDVPSGEPVLAHRRVGDYRDLFPVVSVQSYWWVCEKFGLQPPSFVTEEQPFRSPRFTDAASCWPDFWRMMNCEVLLRGNSTFSWWASTLGNARTFSPVIDGLVGGREHDVEFVEGNHPKTCDLHFVTDLHLKP